jgi:hypothetical protein
MTDKYLPASTPAQRGESPPSLPAAGQGTAEVVKDQAAGLSHGSAQASQHVAGVAREQASGVAAEAGRQGRDLLEQAQHQLEIQTAQGQQRLAKQLLSLSDEIRSMAEASSQGGMAADLAHQAAARAHRAGQWLDDRRPREVADEMQSFARRRPAVFLALAVGAGLVAGRLTRGLKAAYDDDSPAPANGRGLSRPGASAQWAQPADLASYPPAASTGISDEPQNLSAPVTSLPPTDSAPAPQAGPAYREPGPLVTDDQPGRQGPR